MRIIEDFAEALGSFYKGKHAGTIGDIGTLNFNGNKTITTGAGGAIITNNDRVAFQARHIISTAKQNHPHEYIHDKIGYNYRMPNLNASIGLAQFENINKIINSKRKLYQNIINYFQISMRLICSKNLDIVKVLLATNYNFKKANMKLRDDILQLTNKKNNPNDKTSLETTPQIKTI